MPARRSSQHGSGSIDARANLQTILDNLTAGVIVLDSQGVVLSSNPGATRILRAPWLPSKGEPWP
jgi:nitrogen fixation/metabolism regulation signal transduction histidine kinase